MNLPKNHKEFKGDGRKSILNADKKGYDLYSVADVMDLVINYKGDIKDLYNLYTGIFTTGAFFYNKWGDFKLVRNAKDLMKNSISKYGDLVLENEEFFEELTGQDILCIYEHIGRGQGLSYPHLFEKSTFKRAKDSKIFNFWAEDSSRLEKYLDRLFFEFEKKNGNSNYKRIVSNILPLGNDGGFHAVSIHLLDYYLNFHYAFSLGNKDDLFIGKKKRK